MMENLKRKAEVLADAAEEKARGEVKAVLVAELAPHHIIEETDEGVTVTGRGLGTDIIEHGGLRDVAFLMRGVR